MISFSNPYLENIRIRDGMVGGGGEVNEQQIAAGFPFMLGGESKKHLSIPIGLVVRKYSCTGIQKPNLDSEENQISDISMMDDRLLDRLQDSLEYHRKNLQKTNKKRTKKSHKK